MKRALIVSDTHGREENLERVLAEIGMPDAVSYTHLSDVVRSEVLCLAEVELDALEVVLEVAFFVIAIAS